ncbi:MAG: fimbrial-like protein [Escherichia coli]
MKKSILILSLLFSATSPVVAGQDVDIVANIKNNTCQSGISNNGNIDLGCRWRGRFYRKHFSRKLSPRWKRVHPITVQDCTLQGTGNVLNQLHINFRALSGVMATGSSQIFANEDNAGAKNVGVVSIFYSGPGKYLQRS